MTSFACTYGSSCSGCDWVFKPLPEQRSLKIEALEKAWKGAGHERPLGQIEWVEIAAHGLRDRVDLMIDRRSGSKRIGLFDRYRTGLVDLQGCPQMSSGLEAWFQEFRRFDFPIDRGSVRLRVSPSGVKGVWLDFANEDVKSLLDSREPLESLMKVAIVEIGQKRKRLVERAGQLKLADPILEPWFETTVDGHAVPLYCTVGSFTQPGFRANRALVEHVMSFVDRSRTKRAAEFGSGIGNFTIPLANVFDSVDAYEIDTLALDGLRRSLDETGLASRVGINSGNFQISKTTADLDLAGLDLLLVDPPRSGLMQFLDPLEMTQSESRPHRFVYVSCFAESFARDSVRLASLGYRMERISIVDQFPQSRHFEIVAAFVR